MRWRLMERKTDNRTTFTKKWVNRLMWLFVAWISLTYILAFCGREAIAETLSESVMTGGVAVFLGYMLKAFFETFSEENVKVKRESMKVAKIDATGEESLTRANSNEEAEDDVE